jgi:hypothetical protein
VSAVTGRTLAPSYSRKKATTEIVAAEPLPAKDGSAPGLRSALRQGIERPRSNSTALLEQPFPRAPFGPQGFACCTSQRVIPDRERRQIDEGIRLATVLEIRDHASQKIGLEPAAHDHRFASSNLS